MRKQYEVVKVVKSAKWKWWKGQSECYECCASDFLMLFISVAAEIAPLNWSFFLFLLFVFLSSVFCSYHPLISFFSFIFSFFFIFHDLLILFPHLICFSNSLILQTVRAYEATSQNPIRRLSSDYANPLLLHFLRPSVLLPPCSPYRPPITTTLSLISPIPPQYQSWLHLPLTSVQNFDAIPSVSPCPS